MPPDPSYKNYAVDHILHDRPIRSEVAARSPENAARALLKQVPETKITRVTDLVTGQWWGGVVTHPDSQGHPDGKKEETKPEIRTADEEIKQHNAEYNEWVKQNSAQWAKKNSSPAEPKKSPSPGRKTKGLSSTQIICIGIIAFGVLGPIVDKIFGIDSLGSSCICCCAAPVIGGALGLILALVIGAAGGLDEKDEK